MVPPADRTAAGARSSRVHRRSASFFDELEFDRYDDFNFFSRAGWARSRAIHRDPATSLTGLVRGSSGGPGGGSGSAASWRGQIPAPAGARSAGSSHRFVRMVRDGSRAAGKSVVLEVRR